MSFFRQESGRAWSAPDLGQTALLGGRWGEAWQKNFWVVYPIFFVLVFGLVFVWVFFWGLMPLQKLVFQNFQQRKQLTPWVYAIVNEDLYFAFHHSHSSSRSFCKSCNELYQFGEPLKSREYVCRFISLLKWIWVQLVNSIWLCSELQSSPSPLALGPPALWAVKAEAGMQQQPESHCTTDSALSVKDVKPNATSDSWELPEAKDHLAQTSLLLQLNSPKIISPRILLGLSWLSQLYEKQFLCFPYLLQAPKKDCTVSFPFYAVLLKVRTELNEFN